MICTLPDVTDPDAPRVRASLAWSCDVCGAGKGKPCTNPIHPDRPLPGRVVHFGRLHDRRRETKSSDRKGTPHE